MSERLRQAIPVVIGLVLFLVALEVLRVELRAVSWHELTADVLRTPPSQLGLALVLTALNYAALTGYDLLAFAYIGKTLPRARIALASFLAYAISNNVGFAMLSGASVRYRFYTRWGVTAEELSRIVFSYSVTFWLGLLGLGGLSLVVSPLPAAVRELPAHQLLVPVGWLLMLVPPAYLLATVAAHGSRCVSGASSCRCRRRRSPQARRCSPPSSGRWPEPSCTCCCRPARCRFSSSSAPS